MIDLLLENAVLPLADAPADAVAITAGRIVAVGHGAQLRRELAPKRTIDLAGRTLLPGFNDAHLHVWKVGHLLTSLADLRDAESLPEVRRRLTAPMRADGEWVLGRGVNELRLAEGRLPTRGELDGWFPDRPVWVTRVCNHFGIANSAALRVVGVDRNTSAPAGGELRRDAAGEPTGVLTETAMRLVTDRLPPPSDAALRDMVRAANQRLLSLGVTAVTDPGVDDRLLAVYEAMSAAGELVGRFNVMRLAPEDAASDAMAEWTPPRCDERLRIDTAKFFMDGGLSGATAALSTPYRHADTRGVLRYDRDAYAVLCRKTEAAGYRTATHVIGDRAIATALDAYEALPRIAKRARFEHFGLPTGHDLVRTARLGIGVATQAIFLPELGANFREYLPEDFPVTPYPIRTMLEVGLNVALSTDAPVVRDERPLAGVAAAVGRRCGDGAPMGPDETITLRDGLLAYTAAGAKLSGDDDRFGAIRTGLLADLVVLDRSPLEEPVDSLMEIGVTMTLVNGEVVFERE
ncbi:N-substituted formamide deformylase precursor [Botrimarina colliarenosi]|uniref:N-substituted formamide deformylase n=1 Tax=Botrimarina colliarenosi TaxID=2528001 RepID=A0A5C6AKH2_9BACT|nr:amidohydrolase [Botrimarina colliarenosi]TWT99665.1 N-substituted formamide deformylase precursor [Botrimarina colliarenosi]